ncbi:sugar kinase [Lacimicrobium sp. SS2-24]|uniref:sugar kinase n=1 Tax=Lacimicrobium sp. SS2-24 TaxID=2005569 RepID=UPI000B4BA1D2|nr:sugar kinase [Lacimicrobium sp. SS2-24]
MKRILFFGECMLEISARGEGFGGDTLNTALYLSRLLNAKDFQVGYATAIGDDSESDYLLRCWKSEGLDTRLVCRFKDKRPGRYQVHTDARGERQFQYWREDSAVRHYFDRHSTPMEQSLAQVEWDYLYLSGISLAILPHAHKERLWHSVSGFCKAGGKLIFDNNYRPQLWQHDDARYWYTRFMSLTHLALLTDVDEQAIYQASAPDSILARCRGAGISSVVIKRGSAGATVVWHDKVIEVPAHKVPKVVDTCAAGDAFAAGFLSAWLSGAPVTEAAKAGHRLAARVIQFAGAIILKEQMQDLIDATELEN